MVPVRRLAAMMPPRLAGMNVPLGMPMRRWRMGRRRRTRDGHRTNGGRRQWLRAGSRERSAGTTAHDRRRGRRCRARHSGRNRRHSGRHRRHSGLRRRHRRRRRPAPTRLADLGHCGLARLAPRFLPVHSPPRRLGSQHPRPRQRTYNVQASKRAGESVIRSHPSRETTEMQLPPSSTRTFALAHRLLRRVTVINQVFIMQT